MAYIGMAYIVMSYIVMAYIFMDMSSGDGLSSNWVSIFNDHEDVHLLLQLCLMRLGLHGRALLAAERSRSCTHARTYSRIHARMHARTHTHTGLVSSSG